MALNLAANTSTVRRIANRDADSVRLGGHGLSKVDTALLGVALVILGERVNSASGSAQ